LPPSNVNLTQSLLSTKAFSWLTFTTLTLPKNEKGAVCSAPRKNWTPQLGKIRASKPGGNMGRKPRVDRSPEEKWQIVQEGIKSGNVSETCRRHGIAPNLFYRWKDEAEQGAKAALGGRSAAAAETEKDHRIRQLERTLGRKALEIEILKNVVGE
jgi:transposase-like protein